MNQHSRSKSGFTLIELSFAVLFIAVLLLTIALITSQIVGAYRKGVSMKAVNQTGREIIEDLRTSITNSPDAAKVETLCSTITNASKKATCLNTDYGKKFYYQQVNYGFQIKSKTSGALDGTNSPIGGVFCTGEYSYIWNTGYYFSDDYTDMSESRTNILNKGITVKNSSNPTIPDGSHPHLLRVVDTSRAVCISAAGGAGFYKDIPDNVEIDLSGLSEPVDLISSAQEDAGMSRTDAPLALYDFYISTPPASTADNGRLFYTGSFILGTTSGGVNIKSAGNNCKVPTNQTFANSNFNYCAVNKFNFAAQSSSKS